MISDEDLEQLRYKGEGSDLDFKQAQYPFAGAGDHEKSELLKDIMAMANAYRSGPGYILIGFKDCTPQPAEVVGIAATDHIDDAALQQLVRSKIDPILEFQYEERLFDGKHIAIITIPLQVRPFAPKQDFGKLRKHVALVRRGSSTDEVSISEASKMTLADAGSSKAARVELHLDSEDNTPLANRAVLTFLDVEELPDYEEDQWMELGNGMRTWMPSLRRVNRDYYREAAEHLATTSRLVLARLSLTNQSDFALAEVKLELTVAEPPGGAMKLLRADDLPDASSAGDFIHSLGRVRSVVEQLQERVLIDERGKVPICNVHLGTLRPGETGRAEADIALLPSGPGQYRLQLRILAKEIATPLIQEHVLIVEGPRQPLTLEVLASHLFGAEREEED